MEKFLIKRPRNSIGSSSVREYSPILEENILNENVEVENILNDNVPVENDSGEVDIDENDVIADPGLRKPISSFNVNIQDRIRREYVTKGPCQPYGHDFPKKMIGNCNRSFRDAWFKDFPWLEYSVSKDVAYCFWCFLFKQGYSAPGDEAFTKNGFSNWKKGPERFREHVGASGSAHNNARMKFENFKNQKQSMTYCVNRGSLRKEEAYRIHLTATLDVIRYLLNQGMPFRGHDESFTSKNKGNFLELLHWYSERSEQVGKVVLKNAPGNNQMTSPPIQKDMVNACAVEVTLAILADLGDRLFTILVDESRDCSVKEQMAIVIRYVNKNGEVIERFLALVHMKETSAKCLKEAIDAVFAKFGLTLSRLRGHGYDGASNMRGEFNGLKALILKENPSAWYIHCFAHQLQLVCIAVCKTNQYVCDFFNYLGSIVTICGSSCKRADNLRQIEHDRKVERIEKGQISSGRGLNQETSLHRPGDTRWGSHYTTIVRLYEMWPSVMEVLENIFDDGSEPEVRGTVRGLLQKMQSYEFVFAMILMKHLLGMTDSLSLALQEKDQNILNAINQIVGLKEDLQNYRESGWDDLLKEVETFCASHEITIPNMDDIVPRLVRVRRGGNVLTNYHHYRVEIFCQVVDSLASEMSNRFSESSTDLLECIACLDPRNGFANCDVQKLVHLATLYPEDFSSTDCIILPQQLKTFLSDVRRDKRFSNVGDLGSLGKKMIETMKDRIFPMVYRLIELALLLTVAMASVERVFSAMKFVKTELRNKMSDEWLNDSLVVYTEREIFETIPNELILNRFQSMDTRRSQLSRSSNASVV